MISHTTLLIVDDSTENLKLLGNSLKNAGYNILAALNGKQALALAASKQPDLILLDVMMPEMNGFEVCEALKNNTSTCSIPVIFLTASVGIESIKTGFDAGATDYISKPFNPDELILRVKNHLKNKTEKDNLERELRYKSYVLKNISNGITTPLYALLKNHDLISQNSFPDAFKTRLEQILSSITAIMKFTSNLTDVAQREETCNKENGELFELKELLESLHSNPVISIKNKTTSPVIKIHPDIRFYTGNKNRIRQALMQLIDAVHAKTKRCVLTISANLKERQELNDVILVEISSAKDKCEEVFTNDITHITNHQTALLTAKELLRFIDGKITRPSDPFSDLDFSIEIILPRPVKSGGKKVTQKEKQAEGILHNKNILVVEDNELNQRLIESVLQSYGASTTIAHNGMEALEKAVSNTYDIILMDVNVPIMNGIDVTRILRTQHGIQTPVVAISGHSDKLSIKKCLDSGMNSFLLKPFEISDLQKIVLTEIEKFTMKDSHNAKVMKNLLQQTKEADKYNLDKLHELSNGNEELIANWMNHFRVLVSKGIQEIDRIVETKEYTIENKIFHELNNYTSYFGVELLREYLKDLPKIHKSSSTEEIMDHLNLISEELQSINTYFKEEEKLK